MIARRLEPAIHAALRESPAVVLLGPRQVGKTTLALAVARSRRVLYLDLESDSDRARLAHPELFLTDHTGELVVLDEVHRAPGIFPALRGIIDRARQKGRRTGLYLLLGSASVDLLRQSGETLAGRVRYLELSPFDVTETPLNRAETLWSRGGFPDSFLAADDGRSLRWRKDFIRTYLERDIPQFGPRIAAETLRRFWTMLAHHQGGLLNTASFARGLGVDPKTAASHLDLLVDLLLVRRLPPWHANVRKRLVKSPKVYVRDSGLVHALLDIPNRDALLGHPVQGASWEGHVVENVLSCAPDGVQGSFYRSAGGAEIDLLLAWPSGEQWAVEIKRSLTPALERGFHAACADIAPVRRVVIHPGTSRYPLAPNVEAMPLREFIAEIAPAKGARTTRRARP